MEDSRLLELGELECGLWELLWSMLGEGLRFAEHFRHERFQVVFAFSM